MEGWDEVLQPGTPHDVVIQSWRGEASRNAAYVGIAPAFHALLYQFELSCGAALSGSSGRRQRS